MSNTIPKGAVQRCEVTREGKMVYYTCSCGCGWFKPRKTWRDGKVIKYNYTCIECGKLETN